LNKEDIQSVLKQMSPQPTTLQPGGKLKQKIECLMLDIYGTLFISASGDIGIARKVSKNAWKLEQLLRKFSIQIPAESLLADFSNAIDREHEKLKQSGIDYPEIKIEEIWKQILDKDDLDQVKTFAVEFEIIANPVYPMPHLTEMLSGCKNRAKLLGIISNAQFFTPLLFEWFLGAGLTELGFDPELIFFSYQHKHAKPSAFLFGLAADQLEMKGIHRKAALYVGNDMLNDIYPAHAVGFSTALFAGDARSLRMRENDPRCKDVAPDLVITDLIQILDHV
jgi:putative hydrolase of the HAD superfamily